MSLLLATAKTKIFIGPATLYPGRSMTAADFTAVGAGWTRILGTTNLGTAGDKSELITSNQIDSGDGEARTRKAKGTRNAGSMELVMDLNPDDPGQIALIAAEKSRSTFAFKVEFDDAPQGGTSSTRLFVALVTSAAEGFDEANSSIKLNSMLEIDSNIVRIAAAAA